jgi:hypothetical protein
MFFTSYNCPQLPNRSTADENVMLITFRLDDGILFVESRRGISRPFRIGSLRLLEMWERIVREVRGNTNYVFLEYNKSL